MSEKFNVADIFGENVFNDTVMKERLPKNVYKNLKLAMTGVQELSLTDADVIANAMKDWAIEKGATHYTHWFQPLTGTTAEKHDSFISAPKENGMPLHSLQADFVQHLKQEAIQHGTALHRLLSVKMLQVLHFVFLPLFVLIQARHLTRRLRFFVQWMLLMNSHYVF